MWNTNGQVASLFCLDNPQTKADRIIFTSGGSEGNNLIIKGVAEKYIKDNPCKPVRIIMSGIEHDSNLNAVASLKAKYGTQIQHINIKPKIKAPPLNGKVLEDQTESLGWHNPDGSNIMTIVSAMFANNEVGSINDVLNIEGYCDRHDAIFACDCVQAAGQYPLTWIGKRADFATISSHKIHGPKGVGAVMVRKKDDRSLILPQISGGSDQEYGLRGGTENVAGIVGFGKACEIAKANLEKNNKHILKCEKSFMRGLFSNYENLIDENDEESLTMLMPPDTRMWLNSDHRRYNKILSITIPGISAETLVLMMDNEGVCISAGSACRSNEQEPNKTLLALGLLPDSARCTVRVSFSKMNTTEECEQAGIIMAKCINVLENLR